MRVDNVRVDPWIPTVRLTTLMLMLACFGIGILMGRLTTEKIVVTQERLTTAADLVDPAASSSSAKDEGRESREPENRQSRSPNAQEEATDTAAPPAALLNPDKDEGRASREPENRKSRSPNAQREATDTATPPAELLSPETANEYRVEHKREPRPARIIRGRQLNRPFPDESGEREEGRQLPRDYRDLRNQMFNR